MPLSNWISAKVWFWSDTCVAMQDGAGNQRTSEIWRGRAGTLGALDDAGVIGRQCNQCADAFRTLADLSSGKPDSMKQMVIDAQMKDFRTEQWVAAFRFCSANRQQSTNARVLPESCSLKSRSMSDIGLLSISV